MGRQGAPAHGEDRAGERTGPRPPDERQRRQVGCRRGVATGLCRGRRRRAQRRDPVGEVHMRRVVVPGGVGSTSMGGHGGGGSGLLLVLSKRGEGREGGGRRGEGAQEGSHRSAHAARWMLLRLTALGQEREREERVWVTWHNLSRWIFGSVGPERNGLFFRSGLGFGAKMGKFWGQSEGGWLQFFG